MKTLRELVACAERELAMRKFVYINRITTGKMTQEQANHEIECMEQIAIELPRLAKAVNQLLTHCQDLECEVCSQIICSHKDRMHFHHDGCPSCIE